VRLNPGRDAVRASCTLEDDRVPGNNAPPRAPARFADPEATLQLEESRPVKLSVCIATYRRQERLAALLEDLVHQDLPPDEVVVVDNDAAGSARAVVEQRRAGGCSFGLHYEIQPERNIAMTRNRTVHASHGEWLIFVDDDERAPPAWLRQLLEAAARYDADGILGPVEPQVPPSAPAWIRRGKFYDWPHRPSGTVVPRRMLRFGNVLLRGALLREEPGPFDVSFGLSTGEDDDLLLRLIARGARIVWCDEALVWEPIESKRLSLRWLLQRALGGGQQFARLSIRGRYGPVNVVSRGAMMLRWLTQLLVALTLAALCWPIGRHRAVAWLIKASANLGKLTVFVGWRYEQYA
jgi:succinoglycan biosynthesis protein ExoM